MPLQRVSIDDLQLGSYVISVTRQQGDVIVKDAGWVRSDAALAELRGQNKPVFLYMTADWCLTCKVNEKSVFKGDGFRRAMEAADAVYMVGDWTDVDPTLTAFLQRHKAVGVPLYVVFPRGGGEGRVLPTVLTEATVEAALRDAAGGTR